MSTENRMSAALAPSIFAACPDTLSRAHQWGRWHHLGAGDTLMRQGDPVSRVYSLIDGVLAVSVMSEDGREVWLDEPAPGDLLGEIEVLQGLTTRLNSVIARTPVRLVCFSEADFLSLLEMHGRVGVALARRLAYRLQTANKKFNALAVDPLLERLIGEMRRVSDAPDAAGWQPLPQGLSQSDLAARVVAKRETVSRAIGILAAQGRVRKEGRRLFVRAEGS